MTEASSPTGAPTLECWHALTLIETTPTGAVVANAVVAADSPWFSGHFPGEPILPGIAQIAMVWEALRLSGRWHGRLAGVKRIRFKQIIQPGDTIEIQAGPRSGDPAVVAFQVRCGGEVACSGMLTAAASET
jgi:3-hydroxyacyl-[acyl-carrier-protein] dehydratase